MCGRFGKKIIVLGTGNHLWMSQESVEEGVLQFWFFLVCSVDLV